jgi:hypothetical protein
MIIITVLLLMRIRKLSYAGYGAAELLYRLTGI